MLDRLKSLPLTIVITILIWMYAEAQFTSTHGIAQVIPDIPVWVSGPPGLMERYDVDLRTKSISMTVEGPQLAIDALAQRIAAHTQGHDVHAYLDIAPDDLPGTIYATRKARIVLPPGVTLQSAAPEVEFRLIDRTPATSQSSPPTAR